MYHLHYTYLIKIHIYTCIIYSNSVNYHKDMKLIYMYLRLIKIKTKASNLLKINTLTKSLTMQVFNDKTKNRLKRWN